MKKLTKPPRRLLVTSPRNSVCGSARLTDLNWSDWWTDNWGVPGVLYLFVAGPDGGAHRVYCKHTKTPRLAMKDGKLYWLVSGDCQREAEHAADCPCAWCRVKRDNAEMCAAAHSVDGSKGQ